MWDLFLKDDVIAEVCSEPRDRTLEALVSSYYCHCTQPRLNTHTSPKSHCSIVEHGGGGGGSGPRRALSVHFWRI